MIIPKYLLKIELKKLIEIKKKLNIVVSRRVKYSKKEIVKSINKWILNTFTKTNLKDFCQNSKIAGGINYKSSDTKINIINKILRKCKHNQISIFYNSFHKKLPVVTKTTNSNFGYLCETKLSKIFIFSNNSNDLLDLLINEIKKDLIINHNISSIQFIGNLNNECDFKCIQKSKNNLKKILTLSLKTNYNSNLLLCPQNIGQCSLNRFIHYFNIKSNNPRNGAKLFICNNLKYIFKHYFLNLFCCEYLLWIKKEKNNNLSYQLLDRNILLLKYKNLNLNHLNLINNYTSWKNYNNLKYFKLSIGIFQFHNNRNCIKFRFNMKNLLLILNK